MLQNSTAFLSPLPWVSLRNHFRSFYSSIASKTSIFWLKHPALLWGLGALFSFLVSAGWYLAFVPAFAIVSTLSLRRILIFLLIFATVLIYSFLRVETPRISKGGLEGWAYFSIHSVSHPRSNFGKKKLIYRGDVEVFQSEDKTVGRHFPCSVVVSESSKRPLANCAYWIRGKLIPIGSSYILKPKNAAWEPSAGTWSLAEFRFQVKNYLKIYLENHLEFQESISFLSGLSTGDFEDPLLHQEFSRFGLQHVMAISGFHFAILAGFLHLFLRGIFSPKPTHYLLLFFLGFYTLFIGLRPSIVRAFMMISIYLLGQLIGRESRAMNSLGLALLVLLVWDPNLLFSLGFVFSFLVTASILLFYPLMDHLLKSLFPKITYCKAEQMDLWDQHLYLVSTWIRKSFALILAVHLTSFPLLLCISGKFPLLTLVYNLFFPFLVTLSLLLLLLALLAFPVPPIANSLHWLNDHYSHQILKLVTQLPPSFDYYAYATVSTALLTFYLTALFAAGIYFHERETLHYL